MLEYRAFYGVVNFVAASFKIKARPVELLVL